MTDTVVGGVSDVAGTAVPARVAEQAPPEPFVGSGARVHAKLRPVLAGYVGIACGWFAAALACAAVAVSIFVFVFVDGDEPESVIGVLVYLVFVFGLALAGVQAIEAPIRFSRLLRRPSDPRTATVMASKHGGRTLILDIPRDGTSRGYQSLSEVSLALWLKAGMLVPGETVNVYAGSGGKSELLISSPRRGRAFLGTIESQSASSPPVRSDDVRGLAADRPAVRPPDTMKVRGRLRRVWLALWLAGTAGCIASGSRPSGVATTWSRLTPSLIRPN